MLQDAAQSKATDGFRKGFDDTIQYRLMASKLEISFEREMRDVVVVRYVHPDPAQNSPSLTSCLDPSGRLLLAGNFLGLLCLMGRS